MTLLNSHRIRFILWVMRELLEKYKRSLIAGFLIGLASALVFWRLYPIVADRYLLPTQRIGVVGEFSPSTLPLNIQQKISLGLTTLSSDGTPMPGLATNWESTDSGKLYIFNLVEGKRWPNGKPVTAADVNYNIRGATLRANGPAKLEVSLTTAYSPFPVLTAKPIFQAGLRGFGEYRVVGIGLKGDKVDYLKLAPALTSHKPILEYRFYRTEALAILAFQHGDVDTLADISSSKALKDWGVVTVSEDTNYQRIITLFFNLRHDALKEKGFRQALGYALPEFNQERAYSPLSKTSWAYTDKVRKFDPDSVQAKKLFSASKVGTSSAQLNLLTFPAYLDIAQMIATAWTNLGVPTSVKVANSVTDDFDVLLSGQDLPPDPDQYPFWHSTQTQTNITGYTNVKIDKLLEDGRQEQDKEKRKAIYADFERRLTDDAPAIFLYYPKTYTIKRGK